MKICETSWEDGMPLVQTAALEHTAEVEKVTE